MLFGMEGGVADIRRFDPLRRAELQDRGRRLADILGLQHRGIWAMDGTVQDVGVVVTEAIDNESITVTIVATPPRPIGPAGFEAVAGRGWLGRSMGYPTRRWTRIGPRGLRARADDPVALELWLTEHRRAALTTLAGLEGSLAVDRTRARLESRTIGGDGTRVERTIRIMITGAQRLSS